MRATVLPPQPSLATCLLLVGACAKEPTPREPVPVDDTPPSTVDSVPTGATGSDTGEPEVLSLELAADPVLSLGEPAPLTARLTVATQEPSTLAVHLDDGERSWRLAWDEPRAEHEVPLVGARAARDVGVTLELTVDGVVHEVDAGTYTTPGLPPELGLIQASVSDPDRMEPGYTLLVAAGWMLLLDAGAEVVWLAPIEGAVNELLPSPAQGVYRYSTQRGRIIEVDAFGEVVAGWHSTELVDTRFLMVDVPAMHHDVKELPDGTLLTLSVERRLLPFPTSEVDPLAPWADAWVAGDVLVNFDRTGQIVHRYPLLDRLDPGRIGYDSVTGPYWEAFFPEWGFDDVKDWSHANAVDHDPATDRLLVGLRHQDAVVALERSTGEVAWVLAPPANWSGPVADRVLVPDGIDLLPYHMHGAKFTASDRVILFDNGNRRASAFETPQPTFSRAVEYAIDEQAGTFREVWAYGMEEELFSGAMGDADVLPVTDNVLITWGTVADARGTSRIQEVTRDGDTVFDLWMPTGLQFRTERVPTLLP